MIETARVGERKRRRSEGDAAAVAGDDEQQSAMRVNGAANGTIGVATNGHYQRANGRDAEEEKHEDKEADMSSIAVSGHGGHYEEDEGETKQQEGGTANGGTSDQKEHTGGNTESDGDDDDEEEDDVLVVLELADFKNHPIFDDYRSIRIEGIDTAAPVLQIGEYTLYGQLEETVGTNFFYDTTNRTRENKYQYVGQTTKKIKFTIAPPEP